MSTPQTIKDGGLIDIVIVDWHSGDHLERCIASIQRQRIADVVRSVTVVDNGSCASLVSPDASAQHQVAVNLIRNPRNVGFSVACNQGARAGVAPLILFLNPDIELEADTLDGLAPRLLEAGKDVAVIGVQLVDHAGRIQQSCARTPTATRMLGHSLGLDRLLPRIFPPHFMTDWDHGDTRYVDQVMGAFMLMRRKDFEQIGGFDERFFIYMEDVDIAVRARRELGGRCLYVHDRRARHAGRGTTERIRDIRLAYLLRSRVLYARKHFSRLESALVTAANLIVEPAIRACHAIARGRLDDAKSIGRATLFLARRYPFKKQPQVGEIA